MITLPNEIETKIIFYISSCTIKDASNVCKKWKEIFNDNSLYILNNEIICNDTFMLNKILVSIYAEQYNYNRVASVMRTPIVKLLDTLPITKIYNKNCLIIIAQFIMWFGFGFNKDLFVQMCITNNLFLIKFYNYYSDNFIRLVITTEKILYHCLLCNSFNLAVHFVTQTADIHSWITYIKKNFESDKDRIIKSLQYLVNLKAINLRRFHTLMLDDCEELAKYIETEFF